MGADPVHHVDLTAQLVGLRLAGQRLQLADQFHALGSRQKGGGLHHVDEQLQLRQLEVPLPQEVAVTLALDALDVHAVYPQQLQIIVDALSLSGDAVESQMIDHLLHGLGMLLISLPGHKTGQIQQLQLFVGHGAPPSPVGSSIVTDVPMVEQIKINKIRHGSAVDGLGQVIV